MTDFVLATGIENSYPMTMVNGVPSRRDGHYDRWEQDFNLVHDLGINYLRYGPPYYLVQDESRKCNFSLSPDRIKAEQGFKRRFPHLS